jgi:hypothetical protein
VTLAELFLIALVFLGGILISSKVFFYGGIFLSAVYFFVPTARRLSISPKLLAFAILTILVLAWGLPDLNWIGLQRINLWLTNLDIGTISGGRFTSDNAIGTFSASLETIFANGALFGLGFGQPVPRDNAIFEIFLLSGLVGIILYSSIFILLFRHAIKLFKIGATQDGLFMVILVIFVLGSDG